MTAVAGCSFDPHYVRPELPVPPSWPVGDAYLRQTEAALPSVSYRDVFRDARLQAIIDRALVNNRDLRVALANIVAARAQYRIQRADLFPQVDASGGYTRSGASTVSNSAARGGTAFDLTGGVSAFQVDLFGRVRSLTRAAQDQYFAQEASARATRLTLVAEIATDWLQYAADESLLDVARQTVRSAGITVRLTQARLQGGIAPRTDVAQAITVLATAQADLAQQTTLVAQDANALQLLVGAPVDPALLPRDLGEAMPNVASLPAGLASTILLRRPDVVQSEYLLRASNAEIGAARASLFPTISLTAVAGLASTALTSLFTGGAFNYSAGPSASYPIFRAGAARAGVAYARAERDVALASYERTIQTAFREVGDALARRGTIADQLAAQQRNLAAATDAFNLASARYRGGIDPFLNTLDAQRTLYTTQRTVVSTQLIAVQNLVTLYQVLGGDSTLDAAAGGPALVAGQATPPR